LYLIQRQIGKPLQGSSRRAVLRCAVQDAALCDAVRQLQMRLDTLPPEDWEVVQEEVRGQA
jgi:hypothetical protein